jgi:hypothetical protein
VCREGLALADDLGVGPLHLATDCLNVVQGLRDGDMGEYNSILLEIRSMASLRGGTIFGHERREFNEEAHRLARFASCKRCYCLIYVVLPSKKKPTSLAHL